MPQIVLIIQARLNVSIIKIKLCNVIFLHKIIVWIRYVQMLQHILVNQIAKTLLKEINVQKQYQDVLLDRVVLM